MIIHSFNDLTQFITQYFSIINNPDWCTLLNASIRIYESEKPKTLKEAISLLNEWHKIAKTGQEAPLFLN